MVGGWLRASLEFGISEIILFIPVVSDNAKRPRIAPGQIVEISDMGRRRGSQMIAARH